MDLPATARQTTRFSAAPGQRAAAGRPILRLTPRMAGIFSSVVQQEVDDRLRGPSELLDWRGVTLCGTGLIFRSA